MAVMVVLLATFTLVAVEPPNFTLAPLTKLFPLMVILVPPPVGPEFGVSPVMIGAGDGGGGFPLSGKMVVSFFKLPGELLK